MSIRSTAAAALTRKLLGFACYAPHGSHTLHAACTASKHVQRGMHHVMRGCAPSGAALHDVMQPMLYKGCRESLVMKNFVPLI